MGSPSINNIGAFIQTYACGLTTATAGGTGDNTAVTGATIDRQGYSSAKVTIGYKTTLGSSATLTFAVEYQDSADGSTWNTAVALQSATTAATGTVTNSVGQVRFNLDLSDLQRYVRINFTPNLSAANTDTCVASASIALGGAQVLPAA